MNPDRQYRVKLTLFVTFLVAVVSVPFVLWGDAYALPLLESQAHRRWLLVGLAIVLLAADSVAPVPATLVIMFLAAKAGWLAGILGGTLGMSAGVLAAAWFGRAAVGRIAPRFLPEGELGRLRTGLQHNLALTLACWRSLPVLAETSVILAAAAGISIRRIVRVTVLPNFAISAIYSIAADDSFTTAAIAFLAVATVSLLSWRFFGRARQPASTPH